MTHRGPLTAVLLVLTLLAACATTSPLATKGKDLKALVGVWEEEWPGETEKDEYRIDLAGDTLTITPLAQKGKQEVARIVFQHKRLTFDLKFEEGKVRYDLVLITPTLLSGRATGGKRNFDEPVRWYKRR